MIRGGQIELFKRDPDGDEKLLRACQPGEVVGELALIDGSPRSAGARARGATTALRLRGEHFMMFITSRPQVVLAVLRFLADRVRSTTTVLEDAIARASRLTQGAPEESATPAAMLGSAGPAVALAVPVQLTPQGPAVILAGDVPVFLGGAFAKIAATLDKQERAQDPARPHEAQTGQTGSFPRLWGNLSRDDEEKKD